MIDKVEATRNGIMLIAGGAVILVVAVVVGILDATEVLALPDKFGSVTGFAITIGFGLLWVGNELRRLENVQARVASK